MRGRVFLCIQRDNFGAWERKNSEKEKSLAARRRCIFYFWNVRQRPPFESCKRIVVEQRARSLFAKLIDDDVIGRLQTKRTRPRVVRVAGDEMDKAFGDPAQRVFLRTGAEASSQRTCGHLGETSLAYPFFQALRSRSQNPVSFRMGDHWLQTGKLEFVQRVVHRRRDRILIELHQQEITLVNAKLPS